MIDKLECADSCWISVKDKLPEEYEIVLVLTKNSLFCGLRAYYKKNHPVISGCLNFNSTDKGDFFCSDFPMFLPLEVTHWKELPESEEKP